MPESEYRIRFEGSELGSFTIPQLHRMSKRGEFDYHAEYWSERAGGWRRIAGIISEEHPKSFSSFKAAGVQFVKLLSSGEDGDCPSCLAICGNVYPVDEAPEVPPWDCSCEPWCRCIYIAVEEQ